MHMHATLFRFLDYEKGVASIAFDPAGGELEISLCATAVGGNCAGGPFNETHPCIVNVSGLVAEHFANHAQTSVFETGYHIDDCEIRYSHGTGIGAHIQTNNYVHHMGQMGGGGGNGGLVDNNVFSNNNNLGYSQGWECGGAKYVTGLGGVTVRNNVFQVSRTTSTLHCNDFSGTATFF